MGKSKTKAKIDKPPSKSPPVSSGGTVTPMLAQAPQRAISPSPALMAVGAGTGSDSKQSANQVVSLMRLPMRQSSGVARAQLSVAAQHQVGNHQVARLFNGVQAKIPLSSPADPEEQEADEMASRVVSGQKVARIASTDSGLSTQRVIAKENGLQKVPVLRQPEEEEDGGEEEEEPIQMTSLQRQADGESAGIEDSSVEEARLQSPSAGRPLPDTLRTEMEEGLGADLSEVRVHDSEEDGALATKLKAKAFAYRKHIWLSPEASVGDRKLMAHELTHVVQQTGTGHGKNSRAPARIGLAISQSAQCRVSRQGHLTAAQETAAIGYTTTRYDERSIRILQIISGVNVDGSFGSLSAEGVAAFQLAAGIGVDGKAGGTTLNAMVLNRVAAARHEHAIQLIVDFHNLDTTSDTLAVSFSAAQAAAGQTRFETGNLRVITLGAPAFVSENVLQATISAQLAVASPAVAAPGPRPALLNATEVQNAIAFDRSHFSDGRSISIIQGFVGTGLDRVWGADTVQRIAQVQTNAALTVDGQVGEQTLEHMVLQLIATGNQNAALCLIVDFYNFRDEGNLLSIFFDPTVAANASTDFRPNEPVRIRVGPGGLAQPFAGIVHSIAHEYEHVRRLKEGILPAATHEFLGEAIEILSVGMQEEILEVTAVGTPGHVAGFADDAGRALTNWNNMTLADRQTFRARFIAVRAAVRTRIANGTAAQQALHAGLLANYNAVVVPPP
jgi:peptidoglycan hydrolase-like protein with peptidoglycan-binding domain